jgi:ankyrin repeat protein
VMSTIRTVSATLVSSLSQAHRLIRCPTVLRKLRGPRSPDAKCTNVAKLADSSAFAPANSSTLRVSLVELVHQYSARKERAKRFLLDDRASSPSPDALQLLLETDGTDVDLQNRLDRSTPLHLAVKLENEDARLGVIEMLLDAGANPRLVPFI